MPKKASNTNTTSKAESTSSTNATALTANNAEEVAKEVVKRKSNGRNSPVIGNNGELYKDEAEKKAFIRKTLTHIIENAKKPIVKSDEEAEERISQYFVECAEDGRRPTVEEMCLVLGTTRSTVHKWETGELKTVSGHIIKKAKEIIASFDAAAVSENKLNPVTYFFRAKNYYGMKDQQDINIAPVQPLGAEQSTEKIEQKYAESIVDTTGVDVDVDGS